jgi:hypothetical protein
MTATMAKPNGQHNVEAIPPIDERPDETRAIAPFSGESGFVLAQRVARSIGSSTLVPKAYQGPENLPNVLIALELASRIGASPLMVMQNLYVVQGKPSWSSSFLIACVNQSQRFTPLRFQFDGKQGTDDWGCRAVAKDKETGEVCTGALITIKLAKAEGWHGKSGSKWQTMPEQMLMYRAAGFWARVYAPELSLGMLTREEMDDIAPPAEEPAKPSPLTPGRHSIRKPAPVAPVQEPVDDPQDASIDDSQAAPPEDDGADMLAEEIANAIEETTTVAGHQTVGADLKKAKDYLGDERYAKLLERFQAKGATLKK